MPCCLCGSFRYQNIPQIKMIVVLGELGGTDEYGVVEALKAGAITKPVVSEGGGGQERVFLLILNARPDSCCCHAAVRHSQEGNTASMVWCTSTEPFESRVVLHSIVRRHPACANDLLPTPAILYSVPGGLGEWDMCQAVQVRGPIRARR
jgi:hypothetical protein